MIISWGFEDTLLTIDEFKSLRQYFLVVFFHKKLYDNYMKKTQFLILIIGVTFVLGLVGFVSSAKADNWVKGYYKPSTGSYVMPYYRTSSNKSKFDNYSTNGNYNFYTGKYGKKKL